MKTLCKIIFLFLIIAVNAEAKSIMWMRYYDPSVSRDFGRDVIQTFDGGYIFACNTSAGMALIKTNYFGITEWERFSRRRWCSKSLQVYILRITIFNCKLLVTKRQPRRF